MEENDVRFVETKSEVAKNPYARHMRNMEGLLIITDPEKPHYTEPKPPKRRNRRLLGKASLSLGPWPGWKKIERTRILVWKL